MKRFGVLLIILLLIAILIALSYFVLYPLWGRRLIYKSESKVTKYAGSGHVTRYFDEMLFVEPKGEGRPSFELVLNKSVFPIELYDVFEIPSQDQLLYTVGEFEKWEDIYNSQDKYLVIKNYITKQTEEFRVGESEIFGDNATSFAVEDVGLRFRKDIQNKITNSKSIPTLKKGDAIILVPMFDPPELAKKDEMGNLLASWVIVRRVGGKL